MSTTRSAHWPLCVVIAIAFFANPLRSAETVIVLLKTSKGDIKLELNKELAPITVDNFVKYVNDGYYEGVIFHRIMANFMIQTGGFVDQKTAASNKEKKGQREPIKNESSNGLSNARYTIAMARKTSPDSASSQFFINTNDNAQQLDKKYCPDGHGYCVFGKVIEGKEVVDAIKSVAVTAGPSNEKSTPKEHITIEKALVIEKAAVIETAPTSEIKK